MKPAGSLHTIESDIENLKVKLNKKGVITSLVDQDLRIRSSACGLSKSGKYDFYDKVTYTDIEAALSNRHYVQNLNMNDQSLYKIPYRIRRLKNLKSLNLSKNQIHRITTAIYNSESIISLGSVI